MEIEARAAEPRGDFVPAMKGYLPLKLTWECRL